MDNESFQVSAWNNGLFRETGTGYGLKFLRIDKNKLNNEKHNKIILYLGKSNKKITISKETKSFSNSNVLLHVEIGKWLIKNKKNTWRKKSPPKFNAIHIIRNQFQITD